MEPRLRRAELGTLNLELGTLKFAAQAGVANLRAFQVQSSKFQVQSSARRRRLANLNKTFTHFLDTLSVVSW
jgi:hypothetical protein